MKTKKKKLTMANFSVCVTWKNCEMVMGKREFKKFSKWMTGQTCTMDGVYPWDLERYLMGLPVID